MQCAQSVPRCDHFFSASKFVSIQFGNFDFNISSNPGDFGHWSIFDLVPLGLSVCVCAVVCWRRTRAVHLFHSKGCGAGPMSVSAEGESCCNRQREPPLTSVASETAGWAKMAPVARRGAFKNSDITFNILTPATWGPARPLIQWKSNQRASGMDSAETLPVSVFFPFYNFFYQRFLTMMHLNAVTPSGLLL